jgi:4-amino-4-deoxy-L-arabinose transferase-like glycosyltransferase
VFVLLVVLWSAVTPGFRGPDEPQHVNSVLRLAEGGGWPAPGKAFLSPEVIRARTLLGHSAFDGQSGNWGGGTLLPGVRRELPREDLQYFALFSTRSMTPAADRLPFPELKPTQEVVQWRNGDQMTQHPPLYYALSAGVVLAFGALDWPFDQTFELMRLVSVALVMWVPLMAFATVRRLTGNRCLADVAALLPLGVPQLASLGGSVQNDALVVFLGGLTTVLVTRVLTGDRSWGNLLAVGLAVGLGLLTKGSLLFFVPVVGVAVVVGLRRLGLAWGQTLVRLLAVWALAFAVGGWWWALNLIRYGTIQPNGIPTDPNALRNGRPRSPLGEFAGIAWDRLTTSFWGDFGWLELPLADGVVIALTAALLVPVALGFRRRESRLALAVLVSVFVLTAAAVFVQMYQSHLRTGGYPGLQGRYLYGGLVPVFAAAAIGLGSLGREGGRLQRWLPALVLPPVLLVAAYGLVVAFRGFYVDAGWTIGQAWRRMTDWSALPDWGVRALAVAVAVTSLVAFAVAVRSAWVRYGGTDGSEAPRTHLLAGPATAPVG